MAFHSSCPFNCPNVKEVLISYIFLLLNSNELKLFANYFMFCLAIQLINSQYLPNSLLYFPPTTLNFVSIVIFQSRPSITTLFFIGSFNVYIQKTVFLAKIDIKSCWKNSYMCNSHRFLPFFRHISLHRINSISITFAFFH